MGEDIEVSRENLEILLAEARSGIKEMINSVDKAIKKSEETLKKIEARKKK